MGLCNFVSLKKFTCAYLFQIALEIIRLPIQKSIPESQDRQNFDSGHLQFAFVLHEKCTCFQPIRSL